ncbi:AMP-binding protein [Flavobacterium sp. W21_SRS_FM6]|uniref:AMP-binding protein n=1 Tax=Flavobacterium sp. W21_SRS_FM6 TaxID=3240268 RepID=UPI003F90D58D
MQNLFNELSALKITGNVSDNCESKTVLEINRQALALRRANPQLRQQKIALPYDNLINFVTELVAFDGWCSAIYLCPPLVKIPENVLLWSKNDQIGADYCEETTGSFSCALAQTSWYLATSGTMGEPKWCEHSFVSLSVGIKQSDNLQKLCWGLLYQPFRFAGLQVVLQALLSGAELVDASKGEPRTKLNILQGKSVSAISATPSLWRQLLMTKQLHNLPLRYITLGGEIADQTLLDNLRALFPKANIRHIYASTEAGVGFVVSDGQAGFPAKWLDDPLRLPVALKVSDNQHLWVKPSHQGSETLLQQYDKQGYMDTLDQVQLSGDRVLFLGRVTGVINVGGNKVHPEKVEQVLLQCPSIGQVKVYAKKSALMGELVVADVTVIEDADQHSVKQELLKICKTQLQRFEIPTKISIVDNIICEPTGKVNRKLQHG